MSLKFGWSRRSFLSALGAISSSLLAPSELKAAGTPAKNAGASPAHQERIRLHRGYLC
jgi:hypothetical protein